MTSGIADTNPTRPESARSPALSCGLRIVAPSRLASAHTDRWRFGCARPDWAQLWLDSVDVENACAQYDLRGA